MVARVGTVTSKLITGTLMVLSLSGCDTVYGVMLGLPSLNPFSKWRYESSLQKAETGDAAAQLNVAEELYRSCEPHDSLGWKPKCDKRACSYWFHQSAKNGNAKAQDRLGRFYIHGDDACNMEKNIQTGMVWYRKSADQKHVPSYVSLAKLYAEGIFVEQDYNEAASWYQKAAEAGNMYAQMSLAQMHVTGRGVPKDTRKAREWGLKAAQSGQMYRQYELGRIYLVTDPPDYEEAYYWAYFARERYRILGTRGGTKSLEEFEQYLTQEQIAAIQKRVIEDLARFCAEGTMKATCREIQ